MYYQNVRQFGQSKKKRFFSCLKVRFFLFSFLPHISDMTSIMSTICNLLTQIRQI